MHPRALSLIQLSYSVQIELLVVLKSDNCLLIGILKVNSQTEFFKQQSNIRGINMHEAGKALNGFLVKVSKKIKIFWHTNHPTVPSDQIKLYVYVSTYHLSLFRHCIAFRAVIVE